MRLIGLILLGVTLAGCGGKEPELMVPFRLTRSTPAVRTAGDGTYAIGQRTAANAEWTLIPGSTVSVRRGTRLGFRPADNGVEAVVGAGGFPINGLDASATDVGWFRTYGDVKEPDEGFQTDLDLNVDPEAVRRGETTGPEQNGRRDGPRPGVGLPDVD